MRLAGINIPDQKRIEVALAYLYGIGRYLANEILKEAKVDGAKRAKDLTPEEINRITQEIASRGIKIEGELRQIIRSNITRLKDINSYRGHRHLRGLPTRGQRTKTNSRTVRGNTRKTVSSGKRKLELK